MNNNEYKEVFVNTDEKYFPLIKSLDFKVPIKFSEGNDRKKLLMTKEWINSKNS